MLDEIKADQNKTNIKNILDLVPDCLNWANRLRKWEEVYYHDDLPDCCVAEPHIMMDRVTRLELADLLTDLHHLLKTEKADQKKNLKKRLGHDIKVLKTVIEFWNKIEFIGNRAIKQVIKDLVRIKKEL
jgi:hypothetical protein